jgi:hypothetical protein
MFLSSSPSSCLLFTHSRIVMTYALPLSEVAVQHKINVLMSNATDSTDIQVDALQIEAVPPKRRNYSLHVHGDMTQKQDPH